MFQQKRQVVEEEKIKANIEVLTFLGVGTEFKGKIVFQGTLRVDGTVDGEIDGTDTIIVGETGTIVGLCKVGKIVVSGKIRGDIYASEQIVLKRGAEVHGKIVTPSLIIEEGASFNGSCKMGREYPEVKKLPDEEVEVVKL